MLRLLLLPLACIIARIVLTSAVLVSALPAMTTTDLDWRQVSDFPAQGLHAHGRTVIAWDQSRYALSNDGGVSWSAPIIPTTPRAEAEEIRQGVVSSQGVFLLTMTGRLISATAGAGARSVGVPALAAIAVDGGGALFAEGADGRIYALAPALRAIATGRLYRAVAEGVLVQSGPQGLTLITASGVTPVRFAGFELPPVGTLAPLTTAGLDRWPTTTATSFTFIHGTVTALGERSAQVLAYGRGPQGGYHELLAWKGVQITFEHGGALAGHPRTRHLPQDATTLTITDHTFVVASPQGISYVPIRLE